MVVLYVYERRGPAASRACLQPLSLYWSVFINK